MQRHTLTQSQWERIRPLLPGKKADPGRTGTDNRRTLEGILWIMKTGAPWRDLPSRFGKWDTVYQRFRRWQRTGVFQRVFDTLDDTHDLQVVMVDGTFVKVHQHAAGAPKVGAHQLNQPKGKRLEEAGVG